MRKRSRTGHWKTDKGKMLEAAENSTISGTAAKQVFMAMLENWKEAKVPVGVLGLEQFSDRNAILEIIRKVAKNNPKLIKGYKTDMNMAIVFLTGQVTRASKNVKNLQSANKTPNDVTDSIQASVNMREFFKFIGTYAFSCYFRNIYSW